LEKETQHLLNHQIRAYKVLLLDQDGEKVGEFSRNDALHQAHSQSLDLMQVGETRDVAICKIINYESWIYHENKRKQKQEFKNRSQELKTINFRPVTGDNDFNLKIKKIDEFLTDNHKVKIVVKLKSREGSMRAVNEAFVQKILDSLGDKGSLETKINWSPREINFLMKPEKKVTQKLKM
jgi:translation initiation factor IF-3